MKRVIRTFAASTLLLIILPGCSDDGGSDGAGANAAGTAGTGAPSSGGAEALGGATLTGGSNGDEIGGTAGTGGNPVASGGSAEAGGSGGTPASGGTSNLGGADAAGGEPGAGGADATGGTAGAGGADASGGTPSSGGTDAVGGAAGGGAAGSGGVNASGGTPGSGGTDAVGGAAGGGAAGSGGSTSDRAGCKRGVAYGYHSEADLQALSPGVSWWYNWATQPDAAVRSGAYLDLGVEYVPMIWGGSFDVSTAVSQIPAEAEFLLGFNEPNFYAQANLSAADAASLWPQVEQIASQRGLALVSPAVNFCGGGCHDTDPFNYLHEFLDQCTGCQVDAIAIHIYVGCNAGGDNHAQWLINHVETYKSEFTQPLWLTEFACDDAATMEEQRQFMVDAVTYLENETRIARYAWFAGRADNMQNVDLLGADGQLTVLGETYVDQPHNAACGL